MRMEKVLVTPRSFGRTDTSAFDSLKNAGYEVVLNPYGQVLTKEQMKSEIEDVVGVIVGIDPLDEGVLACGKKLRAVAKYGIGTDNIDKAYCASHNIHLSITRGANSNAVADYTFALLMACARNLTIINELCHRKNWSKLIGADVYKKTIGILGLGAIGKGVARRATGFDMKILAYDLAWDENYAAAHNIVFAEPAHLFRESDFICLHLPLTEKTKNIINAESIALMKPTAIVINTARGGLVDEGALIDALKNKRILAAGLDVFREEPPENEALYTLDNLIMGSHCAASTTDASAMMSLMAAHNLINDLNCKG